MAIMVKQMRDPVKILSSKVEELMFKYLLPVLKSEEKNISWILIVKNIYLTTN